MLDQHCYLSKLLGYDYIIVYKPGKSNTVPDVLSRRDQLPNSYFFLLATPFFDFLKTLLTENQTLPDLQALHTELVQQPTTDPNLTYQQDTILSREALFK